MGNPEAERRAVYYDQPWCSEAVPRYFYAKVQLWIVTSALCRFCTHTAIFFFSPLENKVDLHHSSSLVPSSISG